MYRILRRVFIVIIVLLFLIFLFSRGPVYKAEQLEYGVTFSKEQAEQLRLDWRHVFLSIFNDLGVKKIRLSAYWNEIEPIEEQYDWRDLDWQIKKAGETDAEIILAVGGRLPRWPECHFPDWTQNLSAKKREQKILRYIKKVILRYAEDDHITAWQVENEPFLPHFGECPKFDRHFLDQEIALVRRLDKRPIVITDSGELSIWIPAARRADIFGTSIYRDTYSRRLKKYIHYPINPGFFRLKKNITGLFAHPRKWVVIELQAEPWAPVPFQNISRKERARTMNPKKFRKILEFGRQAGFKEFYLWGVEYWYWEKEINGDNKMWTEARELFEKMQNTKIKM